MTTKLYRALALCTALVGSISSVNATSVFTDDFESGFINWNNVTEGDNKDWNLNSGMTATRETGPSSGADSSDSYVYLETSYNYAHLAGDTAILESSEISDSNIQLSFQYHFYGANIGQLSVDVLVDDTWVEYVWSISGQKHTSSIDDYASFTLDLSEYALSKIRFRATAAGGYRGDMALDNIQVFKLPDNPIAPEFNSNPMVKANAFAGLEYNKSIIQDAIDANGDSLSFSKLSGPEWLTVNADGSLTGVPSMQDVGDNEFIVEVSDGNLTNTATLFINVQEEFNQQLIISEGFESSAMSWSNVNSIDSHNWQRHDRNTPSRDTGSDGSNSGDFFMYLETSSHEANTAGDTAILESPSFFASNVTLKFHYHMYGADIGTLAVDVLDGENWVDDVWNISGQQNVVEHQPYNFAEIDLGVYSVSKIRLRAIAAGGFHGDISIDDIEIWGTELDPVAPNFYQDPIQGEAAMFDLQYSSSISHQAADANGDSISFSKVSGPDWLNIATDGTLSGMPMSGDLGENNFIVEVSDGRLKSNSTLVIPVTPPAVKTILYFDDFESSTDTWTNEYNDDNATWLKNVDSTPTSNTGPVTGASNSQTYRYFETSSNYAYHQGDTAILNSPKITASNIHLSFDYHMFGYDTGSLRVEVLIDDNWHDDVWSISGEQHVNGTSDYTNVEIDLSNYNLTQIRIYAIAKGGPRGDIAIDNIQISSVVPL